MIYTANAMGKRVNVYKRFITDEANEEKAQGESNCVEGQPIISMQLNPKCPDKLNSNLLPHELKNELERMEALLSDISSVSVRMTGAEWAIRDSKKQHMIYTAKLHEKKFNLYKRYIPPRENRLVTTTWQEV